MNRPKSPVVVKRVKQPDRKSPKPSSKPSSKPPSKPPSKSNSKTTKPAAVYVYDNTVGDDYDKAVDEVYDKAVDAVYDNTRDVERDERKSPYISSKTYPIAIQNIIEICLKEIDDVRAELKGHRQRYLKIFEAYKENLNPRDYSIMQGALKFLYTYSRVNSIDETYAKWMIGIYQIPKSQIVSYTSKKVLESIAKSVGVSSVGKSEELVDRIRTVIDPSG